MAKMTRTGTLHVFQKLFLGRNTFIELTNLALPPHADEPAESTKDGANTLEINGKDVIKVLSG